MQKHTISLLVNNQPGALVRVAQVFTRRSFNILSINVSPAIDNKFSHMTITSKGDAETVRQIVLQLEKLVDVLHATEHKASELTTRELVLAKVKCDDPDALRKFEAPHIHSLVVEHIQDKAILQLTGEKDDVDSALKLLRRTYKVIEYLRSGTVAITHADISET